MGGVLHHVFAAVLSALIVHMIHFKWEYSASIFFGNIIPDALKFGLTALKQGTLNIFQIDFSDKFYTFWETVTHTQTSNWLVLGLFVFGIATFLFHYHVIRKKTMEEYDLLYVFLLMGIFIHLVIDAFVIEQGPWF